MIVRGEGNKTRRHARGKGVQHNIGTHGWKDDLLNSRNTPVATPMTCSREAIHVTHKTNQVDGERLVRIHGTLQCISLHIDIARGHKIHTCWLGGEASSTIKVIHNVSLPNLLDFFHCAIA